VRAWCEERQIAVGEIVDVARLWALAQAWYDDRFDPEWKRRTVAQRQAILDAAGFRGPFWRLTSS
jgi:hypothetical protein